MQSEHFKNAFREIFSLKKLHHDFISYMKEMKSMDVLDSNDILNIRMLEMPNYEYKEVGISCKDDINVISYRCVFKFNTDLYYEVVVGIGDYIPGKVSDSFFLIEKCLARLKYNEDFSLYDIEFFIDQINKM